MSKSNGKAEKIVEHAEILMDEYLIAEVRMLQEQIDQYRQNQFELEQQQIQIARQIMETMGGIKALEVLRDQKIRNFADVNNIDEGKWNLNLPEGKFIKA